ncbi:MAG: hypothetical protein IJ571_05915 [Ruminococcus sp.]|nr:hypothetical protein [Ruminococcus sp.]
MQIGGAAIATIIGNAAGMGASLLFYIMGKTLLTPSAKYIILKAKILGEIYWVGIPASLETLLSSAAFIVNNNLAVAYGELMVAAMGIAQKLLSLDNYIYQGFTAGTQPLMGYNYGAKNYPRMKAILKAGVNFNGALRCAGTTPYRHFLRVCKGHHDRRKGASQHHVYTAVREYGVDVSNVISGNGQAYLRLLHNSGTAADTLHSDASCAELTLRIRRNDKSPADHRGCDYDGLAAATV